MLMAPPPPAPPPRVKMIKKWLQTWSNVPGRIEGVKIILSLKKKKKNHSSAGFKSESKAWCSRDMLYRASSPATCLFISPMSFNCCTGVLFCFPADLNAARGVWDGCHRKGRSMFATLGLGSHKPSLTNFSRLKFGQWLECD